MSTRKSRLVLNVKRFANFLMIFMRNKRGILGLLIILFFIFMALGSPLLTSRTSLGEDPNNPASPLSGSMAAPSWLRYLPPALGGKPDLSENLRPIIDPGFSDENWKWPAGTWNVTVTPSVEGLTVERDSTGGYPPETGDGSLILNFTRNTSETLGNFTVAIYTEFNYPYTGPPASGQVSMSIKVDGTLHDEIRKVWNKTKYGYDYLPVSVLDVAGACTLFIERVPGGLYTLWPSLDRLYLPPILNETGYFYKLDTWEPARILVDVPQIFTKPGQYRYGVMISFTDSVEKDNATIAVRFDNLALSLSGTSYGLLGTDFYGRDLWAQLVYGSRVSLYVGLLTSVLSVTIGLIVGLASGYIGRVADELMMRISDILLVLPGLPLLIVLFAVLGASVENLILLLGLLGWMGFAKVVRSQVLTIRQRPFIEAAKAAGAGTPYIIVRHVLPNVMGLVYVTLATTVPGAIVAEASLSWLGFADPRRMSWGRMLQEMQTHNAITSWWWVIPPGLCIALISVAFILLGYALDEVLNPKLRVRR